MRAALVAALALLPSACAAPRVAASAAPRGQAAVAPREEPLALPTFEIFRFVDQDLDDVSDDSGLSEEKVRELLTSWGETAREDPEVEDFRRSRLDGDGKPVALLAPWIPVRTELWLAWVPSFVHALAPLHEKPVWTGEDVARANAAAAYLGHGELGIRTRFALGADRENRAALEGIVRWFDELCGHARYLGPMVSALTFQDGPYGGVPLDSPPIEPPVSSHRLSDDLEVRLVRIPDRVEPFALQGFVRGELAWTRLISDSPDETVRKVVVQGIQSLGPWGWRLQLLVDWKGGPERSGLYLDRNGEVSFYYLDW